jgi:PTS system fructose-specific IIA component
VELKSVLDHGAIDLSLTASSRDEAVRRLAGRLAEQGAVADVDRYLRDVEEREKLGSTAIGFEVAIPHAKSEGVKRAAVAFARLARAITWNPGDTEPVRLIFLIAVPSEQAGTEHLQILAALSRKLMREDVRERLHLAASAEEVLEALG